jgi:hypothetical protein
MSEMKDALEGINSMLILEKKKSDLEYTAIKTIQSDIEN